MINNPKISFVKKRKPEAKVSRTTKVVSPSSLEHGITIADGDQRYAQLSDLTAVVKSAQFVVGNGIDSSITITLGHATSGIVDVTFAQVSDGSAFVAGWSAVGSNSIEVTIKPPPAPSSVAVSIQYLTP